MLSEKEIRDFLEEGHESRNLDFKASFICDEASLAKDILAMTNTPLGGVIIIGVKEEDDNFVFEGMTSAHFDTYEEDKFRDQIGEYTEPSAKFILEKHSIDAKNLVIIQVSEFDLVPVLCKKDGKGLRKGAIYIRTKHKRWASEEPKTHEEMREIIDLATDKNVKNWAKRGYVVFPNLQQGIKPDDNFKKQRDGL